MTRARCQMLAGALLGIVVAMSRVVVAAEQESPSQAPSTDAAASDTAASDGVASEGHANVDVARLHFRRGVNLYRAGAYDAAFAEFTRAYESAPNHRVLYNLAQVQAERHDYVEALGFFQRYLDEGAENVPAERAGEVRAEIAELRQRISRLRVEINVDDAHLFVNGLAAGDLPRDEPLLLNAGVHRLSVQKVGFVSASRVLTLVGGEESTVNLELIAELDIDDLALPALAPPAPTPPRADRTALWTSLAATGALGGSQRHLRTIDPASQRDARRPAIALPCAARLAGGRAHSRANVCAADRRLRRRSGSGARPVDILLLLDPRSVGRASGHERVIRSDRPACVERDVARPLLKPPALRRRTPGRAATHARASR